MRKGDFMSLLQAVHKEKKSVLYLTKFGFFNKPVVYLYEAPGTLHDAPSHTYVYACTVLTCMYMISFSSIFMQLFS